MPRIIYSPRYNMGLLGLERWLHPFDARKYGRVWGALRQTFGRQLVSWLVRPARTVLREELLLVHTAEHLERLRNPAVVAAALELPLLARLPHAIIDWCLLNPMRWATMGTVVAAREAIASRDLAINLGGGFHHAKPGNGEGFCVYADIGLAVAMLRRERLLGENARIVYVDLDAHLGNGVAHGFLGDPTVFLFDQFNDTIYPRYDLAARERIDCLTPLPSGCDDKRYLTLLKSRLPGFLDSAVRSAPVELAIYNAGTDVHKDDPLGGLGLSTAGIVERDRLVVAELRRRNIPTVLLLSGGYTRHSYAYIAESLCRLLKSAAEVAC